MEKPPCVPNGIHGGEYSERLCGSLDQVSVPCVEGKPDEHTNAEGGSHDRDENREPESDLIESVEIDPAAVLLADSDDHDIINRSVNRRGKETEKGFLQADFRTLFTEQERKQRHHRGDQMHMAVCSAELIAHSVKRDVVKNRKLSQPLLMTGSSMKNSSTITKKVIEAVRQFNISEIPAFVFVTLLTPE